MLLTSTFLDKPTIDSPVDLCPNCTRCNYVQLVYIPSDKGVPISLEGARECLHRMKAVEGSREGKGEVVCTVLFISNCF
jgi:hypothetical protein